MNIYLKFLFSSYILFAAFGCSAESVIDHNYSIKLCNQSKNGELNKALVDTSDPYKNSYLFDCAVSVVIPELSFTSGESGGAQRKEKKQKRMEIANLFLSKGIDIDYINKDGDTLLMAVVMSFFPEEWKNATIRTLIDKGVSISNKNPNGDTALSLAKYKGNIKIIELLSEAEKLQLK
jgi:hypothetical protein